MHLTEPNHESDPLERVWTVSEVTSRVKLLIEEEPAFLDLCVRGEVTNLSRSQAGHVYFGLKDEKSYLKCVAFRSSASRLEAQPVEGREMVARGRLGVWEAGGSYQLYVESLVDVGKGALWVQFEETRRRLAEEGLFDEDKKRPLPQFPRLVGMVTSPDGAALRDMLRIFRERAPYVECILSPSLVQGETAPARLVAALDLLEMWDSIERESGRPGLDLIIIGRGGGSFEDLACFNDERLARRIRATGVPVISAVGHEVDFTISDFVADLRAATPTQAATLAAPAADELLVEVVSLLSELRQASEMKAETYLTGLSNILSRPVFTRPLDRIGSFLQNLDALIDRSDRAVSARLNTLKHRLGAFTSRLEALDPAAILARGYSLAFRRDTGALISRTIQAPPGTGVNLRIIDGILKLTVDKETDT